MAQTGFTPISIYYSSTATNVPTAGNLVAGELAINTADGKLFYKDSAGVVQTIATKASAALGSSTTGSGAVVLATSPTVTTPTIDKINTSVANTSLGAGNASIMKNRIINGDMRISQRSGTSAVTVDGGAFYGVDRWKGEDGTDGAFTIQQTTTAPAGFNNSTKITITTADTSLGATQYSYFGQVIEGYNFADLGWGTASAKSVTLSFWVQSSVTGTYTASFINESQNRSYPATFTISVANTWEYKTITVAGDTTGTWATTNEAGLKLYICMGTGSTYTGTGNAWASSLYFNATGSTNLIGTVNATFYITGVQLEVGSSATGYEYENYTSLLSKCQRYYWQQSGIASTVTAIGSGMVYSSNDIRCTVQNPVTMRTTPTIAFTGSAFEYERAGTSRGTLSTLNSTGRSAESSVLYSGSGTTAGTSGDGAIWYLTNSGSNFGVSAEL